MPRLPAPVKLTVSQRRSIEKMEKEFSEAGRHRWADQCKAILLLAEGYDMEETSSFLKRPYSTVQQWSRRFRRKGIRGLRPNTSDRGRKKKLGEHERLLLTKAIERGPRAAGYNGNVWTSKMIADYIQKKWKVRYHPGHVRKLLHQLGFSVQYPREKIAQADEDAKKKWLNETYPELKKTLN